MENSTELRHDAVSYGENFTLHFSEQITEDIVSEIIDELSLEDMKIILFLLWTNLDDKESLQNYLKMVSNGKEYLKSPIKDVLYDKVNRFQLIELLGTMKMFKHLRKIGICKHVFENHRSNYSSIPRIRKFLFSLCEELDNDDVKCLGKYFSLNIPIDFSAEQVICLLFLCNKIKSNDLTPLKKAFQIFQMDKLVLMIEDYDDVYHIRQPSVSAPCALALLINMSTFTKKDIGMPLQLEDRKGSEIDMQKLEGLWKNFGFKVEIPQDLTINGLSTLLDHLEQRDPSEFRDYDVLVICIMSHGDKRCFYTSDSVLVDIDSLIDDVDSRCMKGKPKLFFIQACQGVAHHGDICPLYGHEIPKRILSFDAGVPLVASRCDVLKALSTISGHVSYRTEESGSFFISHLVENIDMYGDKEDILEVLKRVRRDVHNTTASIYRPQLSDDTNTLTKRIVFKRLHA